MKPLPQRTLELLRVMQAGADRVFYMPYRGRFNPVAYYFCHGLTSGRTRCTKEAKALLKRELAGKHVTNEYDGSHELILTDAGRAFDAAGDEEVKK